MLAAAGWLELGADTFIREEDETAFAIVGPKRTYYIVADNAVRRLRNAPGVIASQDDAAAWVHMLSLVCRETRRRLSRPH